MTPRTRRLAASGGAPNTPPGTPPPTSPALSGGTYQQILCVDIREAIYGDGADWGEGRKVKVVSAMCGFVQAVIPGCVRLAQGDEFIAGDEWPDLYVTGGGARSISTAFMTLLVGVG